jgi:hypothetical protein
MSKPVFPTSALADLDKTQSRVRAARWVTSLPLIVTGAAVVTTASFEILVEGSIAGQVIGPFSSVLIWLLLMVRAKSIGLGLGREGFGWIALVVVILSVILFPVLMVTGGLLLPSLGLVLAGWRGHDLVTWASAAALAVATPLLQQTFVEDLIRRAQLAAGSEAAFETPNIDPTILGIIGLVVFAIGLRRLRQDGVITRA